MGGRFSKYRAAADSPLHSLIEDSIQDLMSRQGWGEGRGTVVNFKIDRKSSDKPYIQFLDLSSRAISDFLVEAGSQSAYKKGGLIEVKPPHEIYLKIRFLEFENESRQALLGVLGGHLKGVDLAKIIQIIVGKKGGQELVGVKSSDDPTRPEPHWVQVQEPAQVAKILRDFIQKQLSKYAPIKNQ